MLRTIAFGLLLIIVISRKDNKLPCFSLKLNTITSHIDETFHCFGYEIHKLNNCGNIVDNDDEHCFPNGGYENSYIRSISSYNSKQNKQHQKQNCVETQSRGHHQNSHHQNNHHQNNHHQNNHHQHHHQYHHQHHSFKNRIVIGVNNTKCPDLDIVAIHGLLNDATTCSPIMVEQIDDDKVLGIWFDFGGNSLNFELCLNNVNYTNPGYIQFQHRGIQTQPICIYDQLPDFCGVSTNTDQPTISIPTNTTSPTDHTTVSPTNIPTIAPSQQPSSEPTADPNSEAIVNETCCHNRTNTTDPDAIFNCNAIFVPNECILSNNNCYWDCSNDTSYFMQLGYEVELIGYAHFTSLCEEINNTNTSDSVSICNDGDIGFEQPDNDIDIDDNEPVINISDVNDVRNNFGFYRLDAYGIEYKFIPSISIARDLMVLLAADKESQADITLDPTTNPTPLPTTSQPTISVTSTANPTTIPTADPTRSPTTDPTRSPTVDPTRSPTTDPTRSPTTDPTRAPTADPTSSPTECIPFDNVDDIETIDDRRRLKDFNEGLEEQKMADDDDDDSVGALFLNQKGAATGFLITNNHILTAAHSVYYNNVIVQRHPTVTPGYVRRFDWNGKSDGEKPDITVCWVTNTNSGEGANKCAVYVPQQWRESRLKTSQSGRYDYAVIKTANEITTTGDGPFPLYVLRPLSAKWKVHILNYPYVIGNAQKQWFEYYDQCNIRTVKKIIGGETYAFTHRCDTFGASSGSPMFINWCPSCNSHNNVCQHRTGTSGVIGIHYWATNDANIAVLITKTNSAIIKGYTKNAANVVVKGS